MFFLDLRKYGTFITQFFSFWVLLLGYLVFKAEFGLTLSLLFMCAKDQKLALAEVGGEAQPEHAEK